MAAGKRKWGSRKAPGRTDEAPAATHHAELAAKARAFDNMPAVERAAAVMHLVYFATTTRADVDWKSSLPENWLDLEENARIFNLKIMETWAESPVLFELWVEAVRRLIREQGPPRRPKRNPADQTRRSD